MSTQFRLDEREQSRAFAAYIASLEQRITALERSNPLTHAAIDGGTIEVYDTDGSLQVVVGEQSDGTTGVVQVNGPPPPRPSVPLAVSVLGGVSAGWDGVFKDADAAPLDFSRVEVHAAAAADFEPTADTLAASIESPRGGSVVIPTSVPVYVRLLARTLSGVAGEPSSSAGPLGPALVVAQDVIDGIITEGKLTAAAVTAAKIALGAVNTTAIADDAITTPKILAGAVTTSKLVALAVTAEKIAALAITADKIAANAVTADKIAVNSVTASHITAGAIDAVHIKTGTITADKLTIMGGTNLLPDPSFEGAAGAALVAGQTYWTIEPSGNLSGKSIKVDAVNQAPITRTLSLATLPVLGGQQLRLETDVRPSADWNGSSLRIYVRWADSAGAVSFAPVQINNPARDAWQRITGTLTAPPGTVTAEVRIGSYDGTAGHALFDNCIVQPVLSRVQIEDGAITAEKIAVDALNGKIITSTDDGGASVRLAGGSLTLINSAGSTVGRVAPAGYDVYSETGLLQARVGRSVGLASRPGFITYSTAPNGVGSYYSALTKAALSFGVVGDTGNLSEEGFVNWANISGDLYELLLSSGRAPGRSAAQINLYSQTPTRETTINLNAENVSALGVLTAGNFVSGHVTITPSAPNTPTPIAVTGLSLKGTSFRGLVTVNSAAPGTQVTGVAATNVSAQGMTIWLTRTNTTTTGLDWFLIAD
ncbi:hypothetical protein [Streptomyces scopuliridis]|uniref:hypothetical protein n=1 Tax=Streptomyces scopuliridis TaxID=452529 RepID=UPI0036B48A50